MKSEQEIIKEDEKKREKRKREREKRKRRKEGGREKKEKEQENMKCKNVTNEGNLKTNSNSANYRQFLTPNDR
jgi:hypothetical protein